ncbi:MAG: hypothetical protein SGILL_003148 [Bacillariaceae sp.]
MSLLLETTLGDLVIDLDVEGSPELCKNVLKLAKARYYTSTLIYNVQPNRFCQAGDPRGDSKGGACIYGLLDVSSGNTKSSNVTLSKRRFLKSSMGRVLTPQECAEKGRVVATEMNGIADTIGSQFLITIDEGTDRALDGFKSLSNDALDQQNDNSGGPQSFRSIGQVVEDEDHVLDQIAKAYCDADGRPYADIRIIRALIIDDPFEDPPGMDQLLKDRGVVLKSREEAQNESDNDVAMASPEYERPSEEAVEIRIQADQIETETGEEDVEKLRQQQEELLQREDKSRAVVLEMLGDLPSADITAPENVLFVCKLNSVTEDEDLELIFSRFDEKVKAEIIRDHESGSSLQYAFVEFTTKEQAAEAYFKMNNALVDDRRIKVDFSQSVSKVWDRFNQREKGGGGAKNRNMPRDPFRDNSGGNHQRSRQQSNRGERRHEHQRERSGVSTRNRDDRNNHSRKDHNNTHDRRAHRDDSHRGGGGYDHRPAPRHSPAGRDHNYHRQHDNGHQYSSREENRRGGGRGEPEDEFGRRVHGRDAPSPRNRRHHSGGRDDRSESARSASDDSRSHRRRRHHRRSRSRSQDRKERKQKKHKRKRHRRDDSRERKHKKHRRERGEDRDERRRHHSRDASSSASSKS